MSSMHSVAGHTRQVAPLTFIVYLLSLCLFALPALVLAQRFLTLPMDISPVISTGFSAHGRYTEAKGTDFAMGVGTEIVAAYDGKAYIHDNKIDNEGGKVGGYGNYIIVEHGTIQEHSWQTRYAHLSTGSFVVEDGEDVERGDLLAKSGNSGWSTGPHLHFEVRMDGVPVDPYDRNSWLWTEDTPSHAPKFGIGEFPARGIPGLDAEEVRRKFGDAWGRFVNAYGRAGGFLNVSMTPYDNTRVEEFEGRYVHWWTVAQLPPLGTQGPTNRDSVLVQDVKLRAERGEGTKVFVREDALLIYNPEINMVYIVKEGFWGLYMERNGVVTLGAPVGDEVLINKYTGLTEQHYQRGWCVWDPTNNTLGAYDRGDGDSIPLHDVNYVTVGTGGADIHDLEDPAVDPENSPDDPPLDTEPDPEPEATDEGSEPSTGLTITQLTVDIGSVYELGANESTRRVFVEVSPGGLSSSDYRIEFEVNGEYTPQPDGPQNNRLGVEVGHGHYVVKATVYADGASTSAEIAFDILASDLGVSAKWKVEDISVACDEVFICGEIPGQTAKNERRGFICSVPLDDLQGAAVREYGSAVYQIMELDNTHALMATEGGLMFSTDGGASWVLARDDIGMRVYSVAATVASNGVRGIYCGTDAGTCWLSWREHEPRFIHLSGYGRENRIGPYHISVYMPSWTYGSVVFGSKSNGVDVIRVEIQPSSSWGFHPCGPAVSFAFAVGRQQNVVAVFDTDFNGGAEIGKNVWMNDQYGVDGEWMNRAEGLPEGDDVVELFRIPERASAIFGATRRGRVYSAVYDELGPCTWERRQELEPNINIDVGQFITCAFAYGGHILFGTERGLRVTSTSQVSSGDVGNPEIIVSSTALAFGDTVVSETKARNILVSNNGNADLVVASIASSNSVFVPTPTSFTVTPSNTQTVVVAFRPDTTTTYAGTLIIQSNSPDEATVGIPLSGSGVATYITSVTFDGYRTYRRGDDYAVGLPCGTDISVSADVQDADAIKWSRVYMDGSELVEEVLLTATSGTIRPFDDVSGLVIMKITASNEASGVEDVLRVNLNQVGWPEEPATDTGECTYDLEPGWSMVSLCGEPLDGDRTPDAIFPDATSVFVFAGGFHAPTGLVLGGGYWVNMPSAHQYTVPVTRSHELPLDLEAGWSMIGGPDGSVNIGDLPTNPEVISVYSFDGGYKLVERIESCRGYWINMADLGQVVLTTSAARAVSVAVAEFAGPTLWVQSGMRRQEILLGVSPEAVVELPPVPPAGVLDARVHVGGVDSWQVPASDEPSEYHLTVQGEAVTLGWDVPAEATGRWELVLDERVVSLSGTGTVTLGDVLVPAQLQLHDLGPVPQLCRLEPNHPNPFNASTTIRYHLGRSGPVCLRVYDITGQVVRELVLEVQNAGPHQTTWDSRKADGVAVSSGVYLYQLRVGTYRAVKKMMLMK